MLSDLASFTHLVTRLKLVAEARKDPALTEAERVRGSRFAETLSIRALSRAWQVLSKAVPEVGASGRPLAGRRDGADPPRLRGRPANTRRSAPRPALGGRTQADRGGANTAWVC